MKQENIIMGIENIYENNLIALQKHSKIIYEYIKKNQNNRNNLELENIKAKNGNSILCITKEGKKYHLNSLYEPLREAEIWASKFHVSNIEELFMVYGLGNGMMIRELLKIMQEGNMVNVFEPSQDVFEFVLRNYDITDLLLNKKFCIIIDGINEEELYHVLEYSIDSMGMDKEKIVCLPCYKEIFEKEYYSFIQRYQQYQREAQLAQNTMLFLSNASIKNEMENIPYFMNSKSLTSLKQIIPLDLTGVLVAAGPTLKESISFLKKMKGKAMIVAVDRAVDYLLEQEVVPDFIATIDPIKLPPDSVYRGDNTIPLFALPQSANSFLKCHQGIKIFGNHGGLYGGIMENVGKNEPMLLESESVANYILAIFVELGIKRIVLVGQDLAYDEQGNSHIKANEVIHHEIIEIEGVNGEKVYTRYDWEEIRKGIEKIIKQHPEIEVIDIKKHGAKIEGACKRAEAEILGLCKENVDLSLDIQQIEDIFDSTQKKIICDIIEDLQASAFEAAFLTERIIDKITNEEEFEIIRQMSQQLEQCKIMELLNNVLLCATKELQKKMAQEKNDKVIRNIMKEIFEIMLQIIRECMENLSISKENCKN